MLERQGEEMCWKHDYGLMGRKKPLARRERDRDIKQGSKDKRILKGKRGKEGWHFFFFAKFGLLIAKTLLHCFTELWSELLTEPFKYDRKPRKRISKWRQELSLCLGRAKLIAMACSPLKVQQFHLQRVKWATTRIIWQWGKQKYAKLAHLSNHYKEKIISHKKA